MKVDQELFSETLGDALSRGESVLLRVRGASMLPWLREGEKVRILPAAGRRLRRGDIALFWRAPRRPILHRILRVRAAEGLCECRGDAERGPPERVQISEVIGVAEVSVFRRALYLALHPARRIANRLCRRWGLRLRHG